MDESEFPSTPLRFEDVVHVLEAMGELELVLVAGQAVAAWAYHYALHGRLPELATAEEMFISSDVDCLAAAEDVLTRMWDLAAQLDGTAEPDRLSDVGGQELLVPAPNAAIVTFTDGEGAKRRIDVLGELHGVDAFEVRSTAVKVVSPAGAPVYYQHPISLVASRLANCVDLEKYRTPRGLRQAEVAILVVRERLLDVADASPRDARREVAQLHRVCTSAVGVRAYHELGLDPWPSVEACVPLLGERYALHDYPRKVNALLSARADAARTGRRA